MTITPDTTVAAIATELPATIRVFERHHIDFCCGGRVPLAKACGDKGIDVDTLLGDLRLAAAEPSPEPNWNDRTLTALVDHILERFHGPLRVELQRIDAMLTKVIDRHGDHLPETLLPLRETYRALREELLDHMWREEKVLFPVVSALENGTALSLPDAAAWIASPIAAMEAEHAEAGDALKRLRELTNGYTPPEWACPTFRGLYYGLAQLESEMHIHVHLENDVLFPRAARLAKARRPN
jgi:regulator of cell morphogenesis and NO signaling